MCCRPSRRRHASARLAVAQRRGGARPPNGRTSRAEYIRMSTYVGYRRCRGRKGLQPAAPARARLRRSPTLIVFQSGSVDATVQLDVAPRRNCPTPDRSKTRLLCMVCLACHPHRPGPNHQTACVGSQRFAFNSAHTCGLLTSSRVRRGDWPCGRSAHTSPSSSASQSTPGDVARLPREHP
jgi:hypothetical protein